MCGLVNFSVVLEVLLSMLGSMLMLSVLVSGCRFRLLVSGVLVVCGLVSYSRLLLLCM